MQPTQDSSSPIARDAQARGTSAAGSEHGMSGLGLVMQLGGGIYACFMAFLLLSSLVDSGTTGGLIVVLIGGVARSCMHIVAGSRLVSGQARNMLNPGGPLGATHRYIWVALGHTVMTLIVLHQTLHLPSNAMIMVAFMLAAWPTTLLIVVNTARVKAMTDHVPLGVDRGYEGLAIYMALFGTMGSLIALLFGYTLLQIPGSLLSSFRGLLFLALAGLLACRSVLHAHAGISAIRAFDGRAFFTAASRYARIGVVSSVFGCAALFIVFAGSTTGFMGVAVALVFGGTLLAWPLAVKSFLAYRPPQGDDYAGESVTLTPSPSRGMEALAWLLLAGAVQSLATSLPSAALDVASAGRSLPTIDMFSLSGLGAAAGRSPWFSVLAGALQLWAAIELMGMRPRWRLSCTVYGVAASAITIYLAYPALASIKDLTRGLRRGGPGQVVVIATIAVGLVIPVGTALLAHRRGAIPEARARFK